MLKDKFTIGALVQGFFHERLIRQMNASENTLCSYRDNLRLFLAYLSKTLYRDISKITIADVTAEAVLGFLDYCEKERNCSIRSRNQRLASLKSFFKYAVFTDPSLLMQGERIFLIPTKNYERRVLGYLTKTEVEAILNIPNRSTVAGRRHYALLQFLYNTGSRATEVTKLKVYDVKFIPGASQVLINGKGSKQRVVPIWDETADVLLELISEQNDCKTPDAYIFKNQIGETITRSGIRYIVETSVKAAEKSCKSLVGRNISPHTFRHTTAMHLLQSGVDLNLIRMWLGHVKLDTTHQYIDSDTEMKRNALMRGGIIPPSDNPKWKPTPEILAFLDSIGK